MRDAAEVAREAYAAAEQTYDALREFGPKMDPGKMRERMIYAIAARLRARDAEVRADERAKVLAGFTEERSLVDAKGFHFFKVGNPPLDDGLRPVRRLVGPWERIPEDES